MTPIFPGYNIAPPPMLPTTGGATSSYSIDPALAALGLRGTVPNSVTGQARADALRAMPGVRSLGVGGPENVEIFSLPDEYYGEYARRPDHAAIRSHAESRGWQLTPEWYDQVAQSYYHKRGQDTERTRQQQLALAAGLAGTGLAVTGVGGGIFGGGAGAGGAGAAGAAGTAAASGAPMWAFPGGVVPGATGAAAASGGGMFDRLGDLLGFGQGDPLNTASNVLGILGAGGAAAGGNAISDLLGLTNRDAENATRSGTFGDISGIQSDILGLMRQQAEPYERQAFQGINQNLFSRGRLGMDDSNTGEAYRQFSRGLGEADVARQLAAYQYALQQETARSNAALGVGSNLIGLNNSLTSPLDLFGAYRAGRGG